jgi:Na+/H+ antiporter NhaD/arsenite permease-like protein
LSLENLFKAGPVGAAAAIAAGTALIAISSAIQSNLSKNLPSLAIGTDYVKQDGLAMLHKGEAVVPADVVGGGFTKGGGTQIYGRLSGIDLLLSNQYATGYQKRLR